MTLRRGVLLALCVSLSSLLNIWRAAVWLNYVPPPEVVFHTHGLSETGERVGWVGPVWLGEPKSITVPGYPWRPFRAALRMCAPPDAPAAGLPVNVSVSGEPIASLTVPHACDTYTMELSPGTRGDPRFTFDSPGAPHQAGIVSLTLEPIYTTRAVLRHGLAGALAGALIGLLLIVRPRKPAPDPVTDPDARTSRLSLTRALCVLLAIWCYLALWAVLKPALQAPDEVQHVMRADSMPAQPWVARPDWIALDPRFVNPLVLWPPPALSALFYRADHQISGDQLLDVRARSWTLEPWLAPVYTTALATYPPGYYGPIFVLGLSPWQSTYAYRFWTVFLVGLLWLAVYRTLLLMPEAASRAGWIVTFLLLIPTLAFVSSAVTPDSVNIPLATLGVLFAYQVLMRGTHRVAAIVTLLACALTKPSGLLIFGSVIGTTVLFAWWNAARRDRAIDLLVLVARLIAASFAVFYIWSPPRFFGGVPMMMGLRDYLIYLVARVPDIWLMFWGLLGWNDYQVRSRWYWLLGAPVLLNLYCLFRKRSEGRALAMFCLLVLAGYLAQMTIGEIAYLPTAGLNFQGRHVLPACIGLCGLMMHDVRWARWTLAGYLGALNVALMHQSLLRYFGGDLTAWWLSLP